MNSLLTPHSGRLDRHVRKSYLHIGPKTSRHRIAFSIEEAMRLSNLPGEEEGRVYCFRRVSIGGIEANANRRLWIDAMSRVMGELAANAVHGSHQSAASSNAIYFNNREEALEALLRDALEGSQLTGANKPNWFSGSLLGLSPGTNYEEHIQAILKELHRCASMAIGAAILFAALGERSPFSLLSSIPDDVLRGWILAVDTGAAVSQDESVALPIHLIEAVRRAGNAFGWAAPGTAWLTVQAILCSSSTSSHSSSLASRARTLLRELQTAPRDARHRTISAVLWTDEDANVEAQDLNLSGLSNCDDNQRHSPMDNAVPGTAVTEEGVHDKLSMSEAGPNPGATKLRFRQRVDTLSSVSGASTAAGGLFFLLHVLRQLGLASLIEQYRVLADRNFAGHVLLALADEAGAPGDDPLRMCLPPQDAKFSLPEDILHDAGLMQSFMPSGFCGQSCPARADGKIIRIWTLAIRRWCWRMANLTMSEIINRQGSVWLTRTDIDITFLLSHADIRIRRAGLDIDPGWVAWLGHSGKVIRFHYRDSKAN